MKSKLTKNDVLELLKQYGPQVIQENDITLKDAMENNGWAESAAKSALKKMVEAGKMETMIVLGPSRVRTRIWRAK